MRPGRLRSKLRKIREQGEAASEEGGELNIIPYLDIVVNVIMFMLATATFAASMADINISSPGASTPGVSASNPDEEHKDDLALTVSISDKGFTIAASGAVLFQGYSFDKAGNLNQTGNVLPTIPKDAKGDFDYATLSKKMLEIKTLPIALNETKVIVNANENILYEVLVATLDACRGKLKYDPTAPAKEVGYEGFSDVMLSAGVN
jgi:biopolymer transport protein ExbD